MDKNSINFHPDGCSKIGYAFAGEANLALIRIAKLRYKYGTEGGLFREIRYYKCRVCNMYHLTSKPENGDKNND